jgi:hypothetical protein
MVDYLDSSLIGQSVGCVFDCLIVHVLFFCIGWLILELNIRPVGRSVPRLNGLLLFVWLSRWLVGFLIDCRVIIRLVCRSAG